MHIRVDVGQGFRPAAGLLAGVGKALRMREPGRSPAAAPKGCPTLMSNYGKSNWIARQDCLLHNEMR